MDFYAANKKDSLVHHKTAQTVGIDIPDSTQVALFYPSVTRELLRFYYSITFLSSQEESAKNIFEKFAAKNASAY